jgi:hypothetical protein
MAKVWFVYEGRDPTIGEAAYELPAVEAIEKLGLTSDRFLGQDNPRFNEESRLGTIAGYKHVVVEFEESDATATGWNTGYYYASDDTGDVIDVLGPPSDPLSSAE